MKIAVGSDHRGFQLKEQIRAVLNGLDVEVCDHGTNSTESCDYPDIALTVAKAVQAGECDRGILICGSGIGMSITANKVPGIRAALCFDSFSAEMSRRHNDANILCIGADRVSEATVADMVRTWVRTQFEGGRHQRRLDRIAEYERAHIQS
jgi:ribose 5-phosphate isomerase B